MITSTGAISKIPLENTISITSPNTMQWYSYYNEVYKRPITPAQITPILIPKTEPDFTTTNYANALGWLFSMRSENSPSQYYIDRVEIMDVIPKAMGWGTAHLEEIINTEQLSINPIHAKILWYLAQFMAKARGKQKNRPRKLPDNIYKDIIREITSLDSPGFARLAALLESWSGEYQELHQDEPLFDQRFLDETWSRYEGKARQLPRPGKPLKKQPDYPGPYAFSPLAKSPGYPGATLDLEEVERLMRQLEAEAERPRLMLSAPSKSFLL
jgi:hypothetical protein